MISKKVIERIISQYNLGGEVERIKINITDNISIPFKNNSRTIAGEIKYPHNLGLSKGIYGIYDTTKLLKCIYILDGDLLIESQTIDNTPTVLNIADTNYEIKFNLANPFAIEDVDLSQVKVPQNISAEFDITHEFITRFVKSKNALLDIEKFTIHTNEGFNGDEIVFKIGTSLKGSTIEFTADAEINEKFSEIPFMAESFKEILKANKEYETGKIKIFKEGLMEIFFEFEDKSTAKYYMIRTQDAE